MEAPSRIFLGKEIDSIAWDKLEDQEHLVHYFKSFATQKSSFFIENSTHQIGLVQVNRTVFPFTIGNIYKDTTCYLLSMASQYFDYAQEEVLNNNKYNKSQKTQAQIFVPLIKSICRMGGIEKTVFVNNYLFSTNLYPDNNLDDYQKIIKSLKKRFPKHAIVFKTLNESTDKQILERLAYLGGKSIVCRQIYILYTIDKKFKKKRAFVQDKKLWGKRHDYEWVNKQKLSEAEKKTVLTFYHHLYVKKHSRFNPVYTERFLDAALESNLLEMHLLIKRSTNEIKAVQGISRSENTITTPFIGYDQNENINTGLYRLMSLKLIYEAEKTDAILNMSSGAPSFKALRGGRPCFEYHVVFDDHLPFYRRWLWDFLRFMSEYYAKPNMEKMKV